MTYTVKPAPKFCRDLKRIQRRGYDTSRLTDLIKALASGTPLAERHRDHALIGNFSGYRECHITPDWLLIYKIIEPASTLYLARTGTHSDLF